ncbi:hypothetical protein DTO027B5_2241 [Paecilomyces variotii]|nr:hypothetical protein DTO169C6_6955 [Paecilomyces variotii]KAJ9287716.1 hypothetical protein DTO021C3_4774 [Paecilomyces variotii]KAJ9328625.1 hypothetical protein DTO027B3_891 [Paecilomyces variotii]KAJ9335926.1 hypothetical protein DTO027B5_2241 [Paecilomyces variotii]KAJ9401176.1 hypothetical protein DTO282F9_1762 [Paecilomyces variotii]
MSTPSDLQALFASIKPRPSPSPAVQGAHPSQFQQPQGLRPQPYDGQSLPHPRTQQHGYHHPSVSSPLYSPVPGNHTPPHNGSDIISPVAATPRSEQQQQNADRTASLLNLLKFGQNAPQGAQQQAPAMGSFLSGPQQPQETGPVEPPKRGHTRAISASDLVASFMAKPGPAPETPAPPPEAGPSFTGPAVTEEKPETPAAPAETTQDILLRLLNRPKPSQGSEGGSVKETQQSPAASTPLKSPRIETPPAEETAQPSKPSEEPTPDNKDARMHVFGSGESSENIPFDVPKPSVPSKDTIFTYVNPFDQLAAASPKKTTPQPKSRSRSGSPAVDSMRSKRDTSRTKASPATTENVTDQSATGTDENVTIPAQNQPTVSEALGEVAEQVEREVEDALARASNGEPQAKKDIEDEPKAALSTLASELQDAAKDVKEEVGTDALKDSLPEPVAETVQQTINEVADGALADSWESVEESPEKEEERVVEVYNFPLKPFISIAVKPRDKKLARLRDDGIMDVARLKKDFDQLDRSLTSATSEYIVYALAKNGGLRIIRQDDGSDKQIFRSTRDRVFNVALCTTAANAAPSKEQAVLAIGVSGTVYWSTISTEDKDLFELDALESESLIFPPYPASDENTSGGQLKTRAKRSSRHPALFGIGRGKNIYVIKPRAAMIAEYGVSGNQRVVDTEKFFKERALKISTGKAGKDFVFSEDDTVIASLDKTGRLRFWDIRDMLDREPHAAAPAEVRVPLNTFVTGSPAEKSWPTSVLFIDKLRPYVKSTALRYVLVGLKQNHTLQLWDIGLGKAVQEINFPHENESDAICSVAYHPPSGIIVVGHPTRNSIYFVHLSAPRYNLQPMSQASFVKRSNEKDGQLPKPESTACLSGIREISFASKGQLRSLDLLSINKTPGTPRGPEDNGLFELYVMHSRGVTCINIKKEDLGWTNDNKIVRPVDALEEGLIEISDLQTFPSYVADEPSVNGDATATPKISARDVPKKTTEGLLGEPTAPSRNESPAKAASKKKSIEESETTANGVEKAEKKKRKKAAASEAAGKVKETNTKVAPSQILSEPGLERRAISPQKATKDSGIVQSPLNGAEPVMSPATMATIPSASADSATSGGSITVGISSDFLNKEMKKLEKTVSTEFSKSLRHELEDLYKRFDDDKRAWDATATAKQDQLLQIVSSTLSDNIEKNLGRIISNSIQSEVIPAIVNVASATLGKQVNETLGHAIPREVRQVLPDSVARAVQKFDITKVVSDVVSKKLSSQVEGEFSRAVQGSIKKMGSDMERQMQAQMKHYEIQRQSDSAKIEQLTALVRGLSDTVASMAAAQNSFQNEILRLNRHIASRDTEENKHRSRHVSSAYSAASNDIPSARTPEEIELAEIAQLMNEGRYEEGSVKWLQSSQQADLFDNLFVRLNPAYLTGLSPIVSLSVGVAVTSSLETNLPERLSWLEVVLQTVNLHDPDIREVAPKIMDILIQRLESLYMAIAENDPHNPILRKIPPLSRRARELRGAH